MNIAEKSTLKILAKLTFELLRLIFRSKRDIILENLALRQQLAVQQRSVYIAELLKSLESSHYSNKPEKVYVNCEKLADIHNLDKKMTAKNNQCQLVKELMTLNQSRELRIFDARLIFEQDNY